MKSFVIAMLFCFAAMMLTSCKKENPVESSSTAKQIWPLKSGNAWAYHVIEYDTTGVITQSGSGAIAVTKDTIVGADTWYQISGFGSSGSMFYANRSDGLWIMSNNTSGIFKGLIFKYPVNTGESWNLGGDQVFLQSTDTVITVPAGTFHCYAYRLSMSDYYYFCPGVGFIAMDSYSRTSSGRPYIIEHLSTISFTLK
jgi:hypothetical protein